MFLASLPEIPRIILLILVGAILGSAINWAIYRWTYFRKRAISPWQTADKKAQPRQLTDYLPIIGWFGLRRDVDVHGKGFWIRPFLIECVWTVGVPLFYIWHMNDSLSGMAGYASPVLENWFLIQTVLFALLTVATFIDFDEKTIPDGVTITGLIFALFVAAFSPTSALPVLSGGVNSHLHFNSPLSLTDWHQTSTGMTVALIVLVIWYFGLLPKTINWQLGIAKCIRFMIASIVRPRRKTQSKLRTKPRRPMLLTKIITPIFLLGCIGVIVAWKTLPPPNVTSLFSAIMGMAVGGGLVWAIRIIGSLAMQREAMGFGDVTLMFMIGAFLGWQPALIIIFALAPLSALVIAVAYLMLTGESKLAFGPYLCFGTLMMIFFWSSIWPAVAFAFFGVGGLNLLIIGGGALLLMGPMLMGLQWLKFKMNPDDFYEDESN